MWYLCFNFHNGIGYETLGGMSDCDLRTKDFHKAREWLLDGKSKQWAYIYDVTHDKKIYVSTIEEKPDNYKGNRPSYI